MHLETTHLTLLSCDSSLLQQALSANHGSLDKTLKITIEEGWKDLHQPHLITAKERLQDCTEERGWWSYFAILKSEQKLIGSCGFKGRPDTTGNVEIAYEVAPNYRAMGYATEMAEALIRFAFEHKEVNTISAITYGHINASTNILTKCGFLKKNAINDSEDGTLWEWILENPRLGIRH